jgi:hypothetical protein
MGGDHPDRIVPEIFASRKGLLPLRPVELLSSPSLLSYTLLAGSEHWDAMMIISRQKGGRGRAHKSWQLGPPEIL